MSPAQGCRLAPAQPGSGWHRRALSPVPPDTCSPAGCSAAGIRICAAPASLSEIPDARPWRSGPRSARRSVRPRQWSAAVVAAAQRVAAGRSAPVAVEVPMELLLARLEVVQPVGCGVRPARAHWPPVAEMACWLTPAASEAWANQDRPEALDAAP